MPAFLSSTAPTELCSAAGKHYVYFPKHETFDQAKATCTNVGRGWVMVMPRNQMENTCVYNISKKYAEDEVWLGFFRRMEGDFQAVDGKPLQDTFWANGSPGQVGPQTCATIRARAPSSEQWRVLLCNSEHSLPVVCQKGKFDFLQCFTIRKGALN